MEVRLATGISIPYRKEQRVAGAAAKDLLLEFEAAQGSHRNSCIFASLRLSPEREASLKAAFAADRIQHKTIVRVLGNWGHKVSPGAVSRHRRGECKCG